MTKAITLYSGGLDSLLAANLLSRQGIDVIAVNFKTPFFGVDESACKRFAQIGIPLHIIDIGEEYYTEILKKPQYGYGKNLNPCIDCHGFMLKKAGDYMEKVGASFLSTGEVLGERPMSQNKNSLKIVENLSGYAGYIVRPLSALLLEPTIPEINGWVDRGQLLDLSGRSRARQFELARKWGITDYPTPAGGCRLTDANFSRRLQRVLDLNDSLDLPAVEILKLGRHFALDPNTLLIVGRNHAENLAIENLARSDDLLIKVADHPGPSAILRVQNPRSDFSGDFDCQIIDFSAAIVARYSDAKNQAQAQVQLIKGGSVELIYIEPLTPEQTPASL
ncbi:MAG: tRNA 4-thiouridine(8) synthase ThiI [Syntrophomonadaceae bacterium]|jgi:tRNA U34 2-thiouridine synthase MnmA/TrmU|nr:tRNA 4-thiouridine(8) synthase ThiI [Syntrophomonadaceae bacterium]